MWACECSYECLLLALGALDLTGIHNDELGLNSSWNKCASEICDLRTWKSHRSVSPSCAYVSLRFSTNKAVGDTASSSNVLNVHAGREKYLNN